CRRAQQRLPLALFRASSFRLLEPLESLEQIAIERSKLETLTLAPGPAWRGRRRLRRRWRGDFLDRLPPGRSVDGGGSDGAALLPTRRLVGLVRRHLFHEERQLRRGRWRRSPRARRGGGLGRDLRLSLQFVRPRRRG